MLDVVRGRGNAARRSRRCQEPHEVHGEAESDAAAPASRTDAPIGFEATRGRREAYGTGVTAPEATILRVVRGEGS
jgi:hypothetical protein